MKRVNLTISVDPELAAYLRGTSDVNSTISEAVKLYRERELETALEEGYREDSGEAERIHREWSKVDVGLSQDLRTQKPL